MKQGRGANKNTKIYVIQFNSDGQNVKHVITYHLIGQRGFTLAP